jgi:uncharacterized protein YciI
MYYVLFYDLVDNMAERRAPFRESHLSLAREYQDRGELLLAGAYGDTAEGALLVFRVPEASTVEAFVRKDPYVANGLVTAWRIRPWQVAVGSWREP